MLTSLNVQCGVVVDVSVTQGAASDGVTAHTDGGHWTNLQVSGGCWGEQGLWGMHSMGQWF